MEKRGRISVAMIGSRGLPAVFGGVERHVEELGSRLAMRGHRVTVFGRKPFSKGGEYKGMLVRLLPAIPTKNLETATNSLAATIVATFGTYDIIHYHGIGPSIFSWIPSLLGRTTVATIHAKDYLRKKWGPAARSFLRLGERTAVRCCKASIAVSRLMADELESLYDRPVVYIPNGITLCDPPPFDKASKFGLESGRYILTVGRFTFEKGFHTLLKAFRETETDQRLVIVGDARFEENYASSLRELADERVVFPGYISGKLLDELYAHCSIYVSPSIMEGLPITLLESMNFSRPLLVSDIPENLEVSKGIALTFRREDPADLARILQRMIDMDESERLEMGKKGRTKVEQQFTWELVTDQVEELYQRLLG